MRLVGRATECESFGVDNLIVYTYGAICKLNANNELVASFTHLSHGNVIRSRKNHANLAERVDTRLV